MITYLLDDWHENLVVSLRVIIQWVLMRSELHSHLDSIFLVMGLFVLLLSVCGRLHKFRKAISIKSLSGYLPWYQSGIGQLLFIS